MILIQYIFPHLQNRKHHFLHHILNHPDHVQYKFYGEAALRNGFQNNYYPRQLINLLRFHCLNFYSDNHIILHEDHYL